MDSIRVEDIPDDWRVISIETGGGRVISILIDELQEPGDCDYYLYYKNIGEIVKKIEEFKKGDNSKPTSKSHMQELIKLGLVIESF
jgi:hypothetical protein